MDELEDRVRRALQHPSMSAPATDILADVHRGARNRRRRRVAIGVAATVAVLAGSVLLLPGAGPNGSPDVAASPTPTPTDQPTSRTDPPDGRPSMLPLGTTGFDAAPSGSLWRVRSTTCDERACAEILRSSGDRQDEETVGLIEFDDEAEADLYELTPVELIRVGKSEQDLWAFGQQLWSSHDGGATWDRQRLPGDNPRGRVLVEPVGESVFALQDGGPVRVWRSPVSADDWAVVPLPGGVEYADHMTTIGETLVVSAYLDDRRVLLLNDAGSDAWRQAEPPCQGEVGPVRSSGMVLTVPCPAEGETFARGAQVLVWRSPDGETWTPFAGVRHSSYLDDVFPVDDATVLAVTGEGGLLVTADGQEQVDLPFGKDDSSLSGGFVSPERGYLLVTSPRQLLGTADGGRTWTRVD